MDGKGRWMENGPQKIIEWKMDHRKLLNKKIEHRK